LMKQKYSVAITGSHGKTTVSSMISHVVLAANLHPTIIVGGLLKNQGTNAIHGTGQLLIAEADESDRSLLKLFPSLAVLTNIDTDHLDTYHNLADIRETFRTFLGKLPFYGKAVVCYDDPEIKQLLPLACNTITYGLAPGATVRGEVQALHPTHSNFMLYQYEELLGAITLPVPGVHNVQNAIGTAAVCLELGLSFKQIHQALSTFGGIERRFEYKGTCNGAEIFDDYGHHPTEIHHTLTVGAKRAKKRFIVLFQPHRYTRTKELWHDFVQILSNAPCQALYLTDIYPASEPPIPGITTEKLVSAIKDANPSLHVEHIPSYEKARTIMRTILEADDLLLTLGAGKLDSEIADRLTEATIESCEQEREAR